MPDPAPPTPTPGPVRRLYNWTMHWADTRWGPQALGVLSFAESSFFPIPPDVLLLPLCVGNRRRSFVFATICSVASVLGAALGYVIGAFARPLGEWIIIHLAGGEPMLAKADELFGGDIGLYLVLIAAVSPIPFKLFTISAGMFGMAFLPFLLIAAAGRSARFFAEGALIWIFGEPIRAWIDRNFNLACTVFVVLLVGGFVALKFIAH